MRYSIILLSIVAAATIEGQGINGFTPYVVTGACYIEADLEPVPDSEVCENCNGTGTIGDGTVSFQCTVCDGTGKITKDELDNLHGIINYKKRVMEQRTKTEKKLSPKECKW